MRLPPVDSAALLGGLSPEDFLRRHWQREPLLIRGAFPDFKAPLAAEELAGLACDPDAEARLVLEQGDRPWEVRHGPFRDEDFAALPAQRWTLLVQDVEKHVPPLAGLLEPFRFIPDWRVDDLMVSYAVPGGSVGPHLDQYDVFLLQAHGRRRWQIQYPAPAEERLLPGLELRILADFRATHDWLLEPGDMLYLPPGVPHHGVAVDECMTYSIGFRAPGERDLLSAYLDHLVSATDTARRYADPGLAPQTSPGEFAGAARAALRDLLRRRLAEPDDSLDRWLAGFLSEPKPPFADKPRQRISPATLRRRLAQGGRLVRNPASRLLFLAQASASWLYVDGVEIPLEGLSGFGRRLADLRSLDAGALEDVPDAGCELLARLYREGHWWWQETA